MRVLIATVALEEELTRARRHLGYDKLVVLVPEDPSAALRAALAELRGVEVLEVPGHDLLACLERLEQVLRAHARDEVRVAVDGGTSAMSAGAFLACLANGAEAWFLLKKPVRLPGLRARPVQERFRRGEVRVLAALDRRLSHGELARRCDLPLRDVRAALLAFRKEGIILAGADWAEPTELGRYYRRALPAGAPHP